MSNPAGRVARSKRIAEGREGQIRRNVLEFAMKYRTSIHYSDGAPLDHRHAASAYVYVLYVCCYVCSSVKSICTTVESALTSRALVVAAY
jgi:hypothetical protein